MPLASIAIREPVFRAVVFAFTRSSLPNGRLTLSRALHAGAAAAGDGPDGVRAAADRVLAEQPGISVDYLALIDPHDLREVTDSFEGEALLAVAAKVGTTRLIDNVLVTLGGPAASNA